MNEPGKILIVDDTIQTRFMVETFLINEGYEVVTVPSGEAALEVLTTDRTIDLVLLDVFMPQMNGLETLTQIRRRKEFDLIKVIMLTSSNDTEDIEDAFQLGAVDYVTKPYSSQELKARVATHLKLKHREEKLIEQDAFLRQSEERFRKVSQLTADFAFQMEIVQNNHINWLWTFGDFESIFGFPIREFNPEKLTGLIHPDDKEIFNQQSKRLGEGIRQSIDFRTLFQDGNYRWIRADITPLGENDKNTPFRFLGVIKNITELKQAEAELAAVQRLQQKVFMTAPMRISIYNHVTNEIEFTNVDQNAFLPEIPIQAYNQLSPREKFTQFTHPDDYDVWADLVVNLPELSGDNTTSIEFRRMEPDGQYHWHRTYITTFERNNANLVEKYLMINIDINDEKEAKLALQKARDELEERVIQRTQELNKANSNLQKEILKAQTSNAYLQATLNNNLQAFVLLDPQRNVLTYNAVFKNIAQTFLQIEIQNDSTLYPNFPEPEKHIFESCFDKALEGIGDEIELMLQGKNGITRWYRICFTPSLSDEKKVMGVCVAMLDVTRQKRVENDLQKERMFLKQRINEGTAKLQETNAELLRANHAKDEFLAAMSHELRTPLNAILASTQVLLGSVYGLVSEQQKRVLEGINESGRDLLMLIDDILDVARAEVGKIKLELTTVRVENVINASIRLVQEQARQKDIKINVQLDDKVIYLQADELRLKQMLVNLLTNAIKFSHPSGKVIVEVMKQAEKDAVIISVIDQGIGVPEEMIPRLFKPFERLDTRSGQHYTGSGLGLYLVQKMADMHGGGVSIDSLAGKGSRFTISLPWVESKQNKIHAEEKKNDQTIHTHIFLNHPVVLIAEDNEIALSVLSDALKVSGCHVIEVRNGKEVIDQMEAQLVDIVLMDIQMPEMDGLEAIHFLRTNGYLRTPIIALTAQAFPGDRERCLKAGANDYFPKPVDIKQLVLKMEELLP